ncbi:hypothetical protein M427DRAFT_271219 [Gonapodya prolifera JEL478]|uniref:Uncharacterized protein n=1 Tax=Gonapodya prolifera (strain JEL478) TaxID=1344416 RepID=A0A139AY24_GONPJ|nr:hypothetical protein M427DRAFT_271219 [Gonapodya prolifera JEL478]|eukprot:KXS21473.1 hypothetical protein M427DRAFT_271219 [Gonapodya prolifera JEL478]
MQNIQGVQAVSQGGQGMTAVSVGPTAYGTFQTMQGAQTGAGTQGLQTMQTMQTMPMQAAQSQYIIQLAHVSPHLLAMATSPALSPAIASLQHTPQLPTKSFFPLNVQLLSPPTQPAQTPSLATLPFSADAAQTSDPFLGSLLQGTDTATPNPEYEIDLDEILNTTEEDNSAESDFFSQLQSAPSLTSASAALAEPIFPYPSFSPPTTSFTAPPPFPAYSVPSASPSLATPALASGRRRSQAVPQVLPDPLWLTFRPWHSPRLPTPPAHHHPSRSLPHPRSPLFLPARRARRFLSEDPPHQQRNSPRTHPPLQTQVRPTPYLPSLRRKAKYALWEYVGLDHPLRWGMNHGEPRGPCRGWIMRMAKETILMRGASARCRRTAGVTTTPCTMRGMQTEGTARIFRTRKGSFFWTLDTSRH